MNLTERQRQILASMSETEIRADIAKLQRGQRRAHADHALTLADSIGEMLAPLFAEMARRGAK